MPARAEQRVRCGRGAAPREGFCMMMMMMRRRRRMMVVAVAVVVVVVVAARGLGPAPTISPSPLVKIPRGRALSSAHRNHAAPLSRARCFLRCFCSVATLRSDCTSCHAFSPSLSFCRARINQIAILSAAPQHFDLSAPRPVQLPSRRSPRSCTQLSHAAACALDAVTCA